MQGLEKYVMTKLFSRTFSSSAEDTKMDLQLSCKIHSLQTFLKPHHLDIPPLLHNEPSCLVCLYSALISLLIISVNFQFNSIQLL